MEGILTLHRLQYHFEQHGLMLCQYASQLPQPQHHVQYFGTNLLPKSIKPREGLEGSFASFSQFEKNGAVPSTTWGHYDKKIESHYHYFIFLDFQPSNTQKKIKNQTNISKSLTGLGLKLPNPPSHSHFFGRSIRMDNSLT